MPVLAFSAMINPGPDPQRGATGRSDQDQSFVGSDFLQRDSFGGRLTRVGSGVSALGSTVPSEAELVRQCLVSGLGSRSTSQRFVLLAATVQAAV